MKKAVGLPLALLAAALALLGGGAAPYAWLRAGLDRLARDGQMALFTPALAGFLRLPLLAGGLLLLAAGIALRLRPAWAAWAAGFPRRLAADARGFRRGWTQPPLSKLEWAGLGLALAAGIWPRLALLRGPLLYDEAYTWVGFASRSFLAILTDYHLPNNHVLHSLLVRLSALLFGPLPWALRLPAFFAGVLTIPAAWLAARVCFIHAVPASGHGMDKTCFQRRAAGVLAAALTAAWPYLVEYGANARGYTLIGLFTLLLFALAPGLLTRRNAFAWALAALLCALGLFTVPVMLYPIGGFCCRLLLVALRGRHRPAWSTRAFLAALAGCLLAAGALTFLLYLPILVVSGPRALFGNEFVRSYAWGEWLRGLPVWTRGVWDSWITWTSPWVWAPVLTLALFSVLHALRRREWDHPLLAYLLCLGLLLPLQRPELQAKAFFTLVPLGLAAAAEGFARLLSALPQRRAAAVLAAAAVLGLAGWDLIQARPNLPYLLHGDKGSWQQAAEYVAARYRPGDAVVAAFPYDPQVWYYGNRSGIPAEAFQSRAAPRSWVLAGKDLAAMLRERSPLAAPLRPADCRLEAAVMEIPIYLCKHEP